MAFSLTPVLNTNVVQLEIAIKQIHHEIIIKILYGPMSYIYDKLCRVCFYIFKSAVVHRNAAKNNYPNPTTADCLHRRDNPF